MVVNLDWKVVVNLTGFSTAAKHQNISRQLSRMQKNKNHNYENQIFSFAFDSL
jgi:hypothetical protein